MPEASTNSLDQKSLTLKAAMAPGCSFFCRRVEIPGDVESDELDSFLQLQLESLSPFPLEHLQFGFVVDAARQFAFLYAAYRRSFERSVATSWEEQEAVIPEFSVGLLAGGLDDKIPLLIEGESSFTYLEFDSSSELPLYLRSIPTSDEDIEEGTERPNLETVLANFKAERSVESIRFWKASSQIAIDKKVLKLRATEADCEIVAEVDRDSMWRMDLRGPETVERVQMEERRNYLIWRIAIGMAAVIGLLMAGEFVWFAEKGYLELRRGWNEEQAPLVEEIVSQKTTINELLSFRESDLIPFDMLVAIEPFRTDSVVFTKVETNGPNSLIVLANATSNGQANQFKARLERFVKIETVELQNIQSRPGGTTFTAFLNFKIGAFPNRGQGEEVASNG